MAIVSVVDITPITQVWKGRKEQLVVHANGRGAGIKSPRHVMPRECLPKILWWTGKDEDAISDVKYDGAKEFVLDYDNKFDMLGTDEKKEYRELEGWPLNRQFSYIYIQPLDGERKVEYDLLSEVLPHLGDTDIRTRVIDRMVKISAV